MTPQAMLEAIRNAYVNVALHNYKPGVTLVLPRAATGRKMMQVIPGVRGELLTENFDGCSVVRVEGKDLERLEDKMVASFMEEA